VAPDHFRTRWPQGGSRLWWRDDLSDVESLASVAVSSDLGEQQEFFFVARPSELRALVRDLEAAGNEVQLSYLVTDSVEDFRSSRYWFFGSQQDPRREGVSGAADRDARVDAILLDIEARDVANARYLDLLEALRRI
jgi:hypothetical protein